MVGKKIQSLHSHFMLSLCCLLFSVVSIQRFRKEFPLSCLLNDLHCRSESTQEIWGGGGEWGWGSHNDLRWKHVNTYLYSLTKLYRNYIVFISIALVDASIKAF